nr:benenodin family lasso peptide [uncultured Caulobacter sp.]
MQHIESHSDELVELGRASEETRGPDMPTSEVGIGRAPFGIAED